MASARVSQWRKLPLSLTELCIDTTLRCGQSFRWRRLDDEWHMALHGRILSLKQDRSYLYYRATWPRDEAAPLTPPTSIKDGAADGLLMDDTEELLKHYFSLQHDAGALYHQWSKADPNFEKKAPKFTGIRILSQDAWEALIGFICSSNNNISRISQMVNKLCLHYGPLIGHISSVAFHDFPTPEALSGTNVESHLRGLGFGYRAKYIAETARMVSQEKPKDWLDSLANPKNPGWRASHARVESNTYKDVHAQLLGLSGVGPKVADCVCLMGLGWGEAVPVDTHVWQIAQRDYKLGKVKSKTFSKLMYDTVGDYFRNLWGEQAGWAQSVLFTANLKSFSDQGIESSKVEQLSIKSEKRVVDEQTAVTRLRRKRVAIIETVGLKEIVEPVPDRTTKRRKTKSNTS